MTSKDIDASRNRRLWISTVIVPLATTSVGAIIAVPELRVKVEDGFAKSKQFTKKVFKKKGSEDTDKGTTIHIDAKNRVEALKALAVLKTYILTNTDDDRPIVKVVRTK